jgi:hypothetical protein
LATLKYASRIIALTKHSERLRRRGRGARAGHRWHPNTVDESAA